MQERRPSRRTTPNVGLMTGDIPLIPGLSVVLVALTIAVFAPVRHFAFVSWDDFLYVTDNAVVRRGLTIDGVRWALTAAGSFYWHPLTWLSHMADVQLFGLDAGLHHLTNVALHAVGTVLLFLALHSMTGRPYRSAFVAALFAIHPLRVESVAWIAERKDVLSGVFWMLTIGLYVRYVRCPGRARYAAVMAAFAAGLMSKPTVVTLPVVLLLLDRWPLGRTGALRLFVEKVPLFVLSVATSVVTFTAQLHVGAVQDLESVPLNERLANAAVSAVRYLVMAVWPSGLAAFYPFRPIPASQLAASLAVLLAVSFGAIRLRRRRPYLLVGWFWYLAAVMPMIGIIQVGSQAMADRFTYLPLVGLLVAFTWGAADALASLGVRTRAVAAMALLVVGSSAMAARVQVQYWRDSETLWQRAVDAVPDNHLAHANLGVVLADAGMTDRAVGHVAEALRILAQPDPRTGIAATPPPEYAAALHRQLGLLLGRQQHWARAAVEFREEVRLRPASAAAHRALGQALAAGGQVDEALAEAGESVRLDPHDAENHGELASVLYRAGNLPDAMQELREALRLGPAHRDAAKWHYNLAAMLNDSGRTTEAIGELEAALRIDPGYDNARRALSALRNQVK